MSTDTSTVLTATDRNDLVLNNLELANRIACARKRKLSHISLDELKSAAYFGLVDAASRATCIENFRYFASQRIVGSIKDYLRELSWGTRAEPVEMEECDQEVLEAVWVMDDSPEEFFEELTKQLSAAARNIIKLYYQDNLKIREIANRLNLHESRISQLLNASRDQLRANWGCELGAVA